MNIENPRKYGDPPYEVVVVHGGPGAPGEMKPVAEELSLNYGVLEPLQTKASIEGQVDELKSILDKNAGNPITLIGWSWGAWLSYIFTAKHPKYVKKLVLIGSGPFEEKYVDCIMETRYARLNSKEREELSCLLERLKDSNLENKQSLITAFDSLISKSDSYQSLSDKSTFLEFQPEIFQKIMSQASELRKSGELLSHGKTIECPVVVIHGKEDPHPFEGVRIPLSKVIKDLKFVLLNKCGHHPWYEQFAKDKFYKILKSELD